MICHQGGVAQTASNEVEASYSLMPETVAWMLESLGKPLDATSITEVLDVF